MLTLGLSHKTSVSKQFIYSDPHVIETWYQSRYCKNEVRAPWKRKMVYVTVRLGKLPETSERLRYGFRISKQARADHMVLTYLVGGVCGW
jgi:hypothetical protein